MPEVNALAIIVGLAILVAGPGGSVYVGLRAAQKSEREARQQAMRTEREARERMERTLERILDQLRVLNHRTTKSEAHIAGLERRENDT